MNKRSMYTMAGVFIVIILGIVGYFVINGKSTNTQNNTNNKNSTQNTTPGTVSMQNFVFDPATITVNKGDTVTWTNNDSFSHVIVADDGSFNLGNQAGGAKVTFTFTKTGTYNYQCGIHPSMKGIVIVK